MVAKTRGADNWRTRWTRRAVSIPLVVAGAMLGTVLAPLLALVSVIFDLAVRRRKWPTLRLLALGIAVLWLELAAVVLAVLLWVVFLGRLTSAASLRWHNRVEQWWVGAIVGAAAHTIGLGFEVTGATTVASGAVIAIGRHASHADAFLPAWLLGTGQRRNLRYVIAGGLTWAPAFNLFGSRLPNVFVNRDKTHARADFSPIARLAATAGVNDAVVIFPEGQFFTPERQARAVARIVDPVQSARARRLRHLLPPRPGGTIALLDAAPMADVLVIAHVGLERFRTARDFWRNVPIPQPVIVDIRRIPAADVPRHNPEATVGWLTDIWQDMDTWIDTALPKSSRGTT